jgi:GNAT superfamily N-acetyltransferase
MEIRRATVDDAERIAAVRVRSWQRGYHGLIPQDFLDSMDPAHGLAARVGRLRDANWNSGGCFVATDDYGELTGFTEFGATRDADAPDSGTGEVMAIYLVPQAWGEGQGRALMTAALRHLTECGYGQVTLWVLDANNRARRFYAAAGFMPDGATKVDASRGFPLTEVRYRRDLP